MRFLVRITVLALAVSAFFTIDFFQRHTEAQRVRPARPEGEFSCIPAPGGMVGWWPGEGNGDDIRGENPGSLENVTFTPAEVGYGFSFTGLRGVVVPDSEIFNQQNFTIETWATLAPFTCPGPQPCGAFIVAKSGSTGNFGYELAVRGDGSVDFLINGGTGGGEVTSVGTFADGSFHHLAATYDGEVMRLYIDGALNNSAGFGGGVFYEGDSEFIIGGREAADSTLTYPGIIDEPSFYTRVLSEDEITTIANAQTLGKCRPRCTDPSLYSLQGWWTGDDNAFDIWDRNHGIEIAKGNFDYGIGKVGRGFDFDGSSEVRIPPDDDLDVGNFNGFTVDAWIRPNFIDDMPIVAWSNGIDLGVNLFIINNVGTVNRPEGTTTPGRLAADIVDNEGTSHQVVSDGAPIYPNVFQHVAVTYNNGTQTATLYVNGVIVGQEFFDTGSFTPETSFDVHIGGVEFDIGQEKARKKIRPNGLPGFFFSGVIDEVEIMSRDLSDFEVLALNNAASAGKCKPCLFPPFQMSGWWNGDANSRDDSGNGNNGSYNGGYRLGKVGQAFNFDAQANEGVVVPNNDSISPTTGITLDAWVNPSSLPNSSPVVFRKGTDYELSLFNGKGAAEAACTIGGQGTIIGGFVPLDAWTHLACTYDSGSGLTRVYVNGIQVAGNFGQATPIPTSTEDLGIGKRVDTNTQNFDGGIDEAEIFTRELSPDDIQSLVAAGVSGKCKLNGISKGDGAKAEGGNVFSVTLGDAQITYVNPPFTPSTSYQTLDSYQPGPMPFGYVTPLEVVDITSDLQNTGPVHICFNLQAPEFDVPFQQLRILHLEGNTLVNRTSLSQPANRTLCADVNSLSPFVIAQNVIAPTASPAIITGRITLPDGSPLAGVALRLTGAQSLETITDANGSYTFNGVRADSFYTVTPQLSNFSFSPRDRSFTVLGSRVEAAFGATADAVPTQNPLDTDLYFVRQQYLDFLGREPDAGGLAYWTAQLRTCGSDRQCLLRRRLEVSAAFFDSREFQQTGSFIYRLYKGSLGRQPGFTEFSSDQRLLLGDAGQAGFSDQFVQRAEFAQKYQSQTTGETFVTALLDSVRQSSGVDLSGDYANLVAKYNSGSNLNQSRALVLTEVGKSPALQQATYNSGFVLMEYFGYLRRDPEPAGYDFWLDVLNNQVAGNYRGMVCAFVTSAEYQHRFSPIVTSSNADCGQQ